MNPTRTRPAAAGGPLHDPARPLDVSGLDWVITGGESGPGARPCAPEWVRAIRDACQDTGVAFFHKQWGGPHPKAAGRLLDGRTHDAFPTSAVAMDGGRS